MKAIDFVVRDNAGGVQRGTIPAGSSSQNIQVTSGQEVSLNLRQVDLQSQTRSGDDLVVTLADGRVITIENYFDDSGAANRLFISADGYLNEVTFIGTQDNTLYAQYGPTEQWGKWSPSDDLIFLGRTEVAAAGVVAEEEVTMFAAPLLGGGLLGGGAAGAAAVVGGAAVIGGVGSGGGGGGGAVDNPNGDGADTGGGGEGTDAGGGGGASGGGEGNGGGAGSGGTGGDGGGGGDVHVPADPYVDNADASTDIGGDDSGPHIITISGGGEPGDAVTVKVGQQTVETVITDQGVFVVSFEGDTFPTDGQYEAEVLVFTGTGVVTLDGPSYVIDTVGPEISVTSGTGSVQDFFNAVSFDEGVTLTGSGEPGASVLVTVSGSEQFTTVSSSGTWSVTWPAGVLQGGEYETGVTIVASDSFGNTTTLTDTLIVDTVTDVTIETSTVETDGVVNAVERSDGVTLTGTAQVGSTVIVTFGTGSHQATVDASGNWSATFSMAEVPSGEMEATITATATDTSGNTTTTTGLVDIDTLVRDFSFTGTTGGDDGVINIAEAAQSLVMTGTTEPGSTVVVTMNGFSHQASVSASGQWSVSFASSEIPGGTRVAVMTAVATDAAGNVETITRDVAIDRDAGTLTISSAPVEGDDVVNAAEASDGVVLSGTSNPGALVTVTMAGVSHRVTTDAGGTWQTTFAPGEVAPGVYTASIQATTTDSAGNTLNASDSVQVDTRVDNLSVHADQVEGDGVINGFERTSNGGAQISGTTEVGSTSVVVTLNGVSTNAAVDGAGNWTAFYAAGQIAEGTYDAAVSVTATDAAGNSATITDSVHVDTEVVPLNMTNGGGGVDGVASFAEAATGIDLGGQVEPGSRVVVNFDGTDHAAFVDGAGNWSVTIPPSAIRGGTYDAAVRVTATDAVGNVDAITDTLAIDTDAPDGPVIASYTRDGDGIRGISTDMSDDLLEVHQVHGNGAITDVASSETDIPGLGETNFAFQSTVPDGSHLVVTATDDAGNSTGTYVVLDDEMSNSNVGLSNPGLGQYNVETADLTFAEEARLTLDEAALLALSENTNALQILGGADDQVTITGAQKTGSTVREGQRYDVYALGDEGKVVIDEDVNVVI